MMEEKKYYRRVCGKCLQEKNDDVVHVKKDPLDPHSKCEEIPLGDRYEIIEIVTEKGE